MRHPTLIIILALAVFPACEETSDGDDGSDSAGVTSAATADPSADETTAATSPGTTQGPPSTAVADCRDICDYLQAVSCVDADLHETCWNACAVRSEADIELFIACENNHPGCIDSGCLENFLDADPIDPPDPQSCVEACSGFVAMGCGADLGFGSCQEFCGSLSESLQEFAVMCIQDADGCDLPPECMFPDGG